MKKTFRFASFLLCLFLCLSFASPVFADAVTTEASEEPETPDLPAEEEPFDPDAGIPDLSGVSSLWLFCVDTDTDLYEKDADKLLMPSGTVKLMTALTAYEMIPDLSVSVTVTADMLAGSSGTSYGFKSGDVVTYADLLRILLIRSANDAAYVLANSLAGSSTAFVEKMNENASSWGLTSTVYKNVSGIDKLGQYTTARDVGVLLKRFRQNSFLLNASGKESHKLESANKEKIYSRNYFLSNYYNGGKSYRDSAVIGGIVGTTANAGYCSACAYEYSGKTYLCVILGASESKEDGIASYVVPPKIVKWASGQFRYYTILAKWKALAEVSIVHGDGYDYAAAFCLDNVSCYLRKYVNEATDVTYEVEMDCTSLEAPVAAGTKVGHVRAYYDGNVIAESDLVIRSDVALSRSAVRVEKIRAFLLSKPFIISAISVFAAFLVYIFIMAFYRGSKIRKMQDQKDERL